MFFEFSNVGVARVHRNKSKQVYTRKFLALLYTGKIKRVRTGKDRIELYLSKTLKL
jgi:hypothetical protein